MAYVEPKTDWNEAYEPSPEDINRIEANTKQNHDDIEAEESARISADSTLQDNIEELQDNIEELQDEKAGYYQGSSVNETNLPIGSIIAAQQDGGGSPNRNESVNVYLKSGEPSQYTLDSSDSGGTLSGVWRARGFTGRVGTTTNGNGWLLQRVS